VSAHVVRFDRVGAAQCECGWSTDETGDAAVMAVERHVTDEVAPLIPSPRGAADPTDGGGRATP